MGQQDVFNQEKRENKSIIMKIIAAITLTLNSVESKPQEDVFHTDDSFFNGPSTERRYKDLHAITLHYNPTFDHRKQWYYGCHCLMLSDRAIFECDKMYASELAASNALETWTTDYHGYWSTTGFDYKDGESCKKRPGNSVPECCGGQDKPYFLYNVLNPNKQCCADGTIQKQCPELR